MSIDREGNEQAAYFHYLRVRHPLAFELAYHTPNGGSRKGGAREGARLKAQGVRAGVPDVCIPIARGGYFGLYIEFKATPPHDSRVSPSQKEWLKKLSDQNYKAVLCKGFDAIKAETERYLALPETKVVMCE